MAIDKSVGGADTWDDIAEYGETKEAFLRRVLPLANGVSSADTLARVFAKPDPARFARAFGRVGRRPAARAARAPPLNTDS